MQQLKSLSRSTKNIDITLIAVAILIIISMALLVSFDQMNTMFYILGGTLAVIIALIIFFQPQFGGYLLIITAMSTISDIVVGNGYPSITRPLIGIIFFSILANYVFRKGKSNPAVNFSRTEMFLLGYFFVSWLSIAVALDQSTAISDGIDLAKELIVVLSIVLTLITWNYWKRGLWLVLIIIFFLALIGTIQSAFNIYDNEFLGFGKIYVDYISEYEDTYRITGPLDDPNYWGMVLVSVLPIAIYRVLDEKRLYLKLISLVMAATILFTLLNTYSRGAFVALIVALILIAVERRLSWPILVFVGLIVFLFVSFAPQRYLERMQTLVSLVNPNDQYAIYQDSSYRGRYSEALVGLEMFFDHPVLGVGIGNYDTNYQDYARFLGIETRSEQREAHSLYIEILAETGILGLIFFIGMAFYLIRDQIQFRKFVISNKMFRNWDSWVSSSLISVITYLVTSIFLHGAYERYFWLFIALALSINQIGKKMMKLENDSMDNMVLGQKIKN